MVGVVDSIKLNLMLKKIRKNNDFESLIDYIDDVKSDFPCDVLEEIVTVICNNPDSYYIYNFVQKVNNLTAVHINKLTLAILKTDSAGYIRRYLNMLNVNVIDKDVINSFGLRLCELKNFSVIRDVILNYEHFDEYVYKKGIKTIIKNDSLEDVCDFVCKVKSLDKEDKDLLVQRVCNEQNAYYICFVSRLFLEYDREVFVDSILKCNDPEMLYCFIKYNKLDEDSINILVDKLCSLKNNEYLYKTLGIVYNINSARAKILQTIKKSSDIKYMVLSCFYTDTILTHKEYNFDYLYRYMLNSNIYTSEELIDVYKVYNKRSLKNINKKK